MNRLELARRRNEIKVLLVISFTIFAMVCEIAFGYITNSMSLLAQGYHISVHVLTLGLTYIAYVLARKLKNSPKFGNGTYKIGVLAGYTSALILGFAGFKILFKAAERFINPSTIQFNEAIYVAIFAFVINFICISIMEGNFHRHKKRKTKDYNYKAAYYHILSDVMVSILTIFALVIGKFFNCTYFDALTGILGAILIIIWAGKLIKNTVKILVDMN